jgi:hypothetical protein
MHNKQKSFSLHNFYYRVMFSSLVWESMQVLGKLSEFNEDTLEWILWHQGIPGNEKADRLAKEGSTEVLPNRFTSIPFSAGKKLIKNHLDLRHQARWAACADCRQSKMLMRYPLSSRANELLEISILRLRAAVGLLTGHTTLRAY